jgi:beta-glucanase (GH16 family)
MNMKYHLILTSFLLGVSALARTNQTITLPPPGYKLAWSDEFDGSALDTNKWDYRTDSKMWSTQLPQNVSVRDGKLILAVKKEDAGDKHYTGAGVISKAAFKYGYYEARFKVPPGAGWHTSFWMMKQDGKGGTNPHAAAQELDVCENDSVTLTNYGVNVHKWNPQPHVSMGHKNVKTPDLSAGFHVFGCEFTPETVKYYFEGKLVQTVAVTNFAHGDQHIWLTTIASHLGGTKAVDDAKLPATAEFDYVRFYEKGKGTTNFSCRIKTGVATSPHANP